MKLITKAKRYREDEPEKNKPFGRIIPAFDTLPQSIIVLTFVLPFSLVVLKLVGTPHAMLVERFQIMWPDGGASDLQVRRGKEQY